MSRTRLSVLIAAAFAINMTDCKTPVHKAEPDAKIGEELTLGTTSFKVEEAQILESITLDSGLFGGGPSKMTPQDPSQIFFESKLAITNLSDHPVTIPHQKIALYGGNGKRYYGFAQKTDPTIEAKATLDLTRTFVMEREAVPGVRFQVQDLSSEQTGIIDLGMK